MTVDLVTLLGDHHEVRELAGAAHAQPASLLSQEPSVVGQTSRVGTD